MISQYNCWILNDKNKPMNSKELIGFYFFIPLL